MTTLLCPAAIVPPPAESKIGAPPAPGPMNFPEDLMLPPAPKIPLKTLGAAFLRGMLLESRASLTVPEARLLAFRAVRPDSAPETDAALSVPVKALAVAFFN